MAGRQTGPTTTLAMPRQDGPPRGLTASPPRRPAPRPLLLHLALSNLTMLSSFAALPHAKLGSLNWSEPLNQAGADLARDLVNVDPEQFFFAVAEAARGRLKAALDGIAGYRAHPYQRTLPEPPVIWRAGAARLLDYGGDNGGATVLFVPSLVNRAYVLDLTLRRSLLRYLAAAGLRPLLLDWGSPGARECRYALADYVEGPLAAALQVANLVGGGPVGLAGYCLGGTLAVAAAQRYPDQVAALALLATPWDFHAPAGVPVVALRLLAALQPTLSALLAGSPVLSVDLLQALLLGLDPASTLRKFAAFSRLDPESDAASEFVALEDWLNDGVPLAGPAARDCLIGFYGRNAAQAGQWRVAGAPVEPGRLAVPTLVAVPEEDRVVPAPTALALAQLIPGAVLLRPRAGHIGMVAGGKAETVLWRPLVDWLRATLISQTPVSERRAAMG